MHIFLIGRLTGGGVIGIIRVIMTGPDAIFSGTGREGIKLFGGKAV